MSMDVQLCIIMNLPTRRLATYSGLRMSILAEHVTTWERGCDRGRAVALPPSLTCSLQRKRYMPLADSVMTMKIAT